MKILDIILIVLTLAVISQVGQYSATHLSPSPSPTLQSRIVIPSASIQIFEVSTKPDVLHAIQALKEQSALPSPVITKVEPFSPPDGSFKAYFPGEVREDVFDSTGSLGSYKMYVYTSQNVIARSGNQIWYEDLPQYIVNSIPAEKILDFGKEQDVGIFEDSVELFEDYNITFNGFPGRVEKYNMAGTDNVAEYKRILVNNRLYVLSATTPKTEEGLASINTFFLTFAVGPFQSSSK